VKRKGEEKKPSPWAQKKGLRRKIRVPGGRGGDQGKRKGGCPGLARKGDRTEKKPTFLRSTLACGKRFKKRRSPKEPLLEKGESTSKQKEEKSQKGGKEKEREEIRRKKGIAV